METFRQQGNYQVTKTDAEFHCVFKPSPKALLGFCVFSLIWTTVSIAFCIILCAGVFTGVVPWPFLFFLILFCFFEGVVLYGLAQTFFGKETLTLNADGFLYYWTLFCFCKTRKIPIQDVEKITCKIHYKYPEDNYASGTLHISSFFHPPITLTESIREGELREMFQLIRETYEHIRPNDPGYDKIFVIIDHNKR